MAQSSLPFFGARKRKSSLMTRGPDRQSGVARLMAAKVARNDHFRVSSFFFAAVVCGDNKVEWSALSFSWFFRPNDEPAGHQLWKPSLALLAVAGAQRIIRSTRGFWVTEQRAVFGTIAVFLATNTYGTHDANVKRHGFYLSNSFSIWSFTASVRLKQRQLTSPSCNE